jgi:hypothetical protein
MYYFNLNKYLMYEGFYQMRTSLHKKRDVHHCIRSFIGCDVEMIMLTGHL